MSLRRVTFALPSSDPASATIADWLDTLPDDADLSPLLRQALANGIAATQMLARIEARLDALQPHPSATMPPMQLDSLDEQEQALLSNMLDF